MEPWTLFCLYVFVSLFGFVGLRMRDIPQLLAFVPCALGFFGCMTIGLYTESTAFESNFYRKGVSEYERTVVQYDADGKYVQSGLWIWCRNNCANRVPVSFNMGSSVTPITENPKARHIRYAVGVRITDLPKYAATVGVKDDDDNPDRAAGAIGYELYEFNNAHSKTLAQFYNPLDARQTNGLAALLKREINPRLKSKGMEITELVSWDVE